MYVDKAEPTDHVVATADAPALQQACIDLDDIAHEQLMGYVVQIHAG